MSEVDVYYAQEEEVVLPNARTVPVVLTGSDVPDMPIDEVVERAKGDREFRRKLKYPEEIKLKVEEMLRTYIAHVGDHVLNRLLQLNPRLQIGTVLPHRMALISRISRAYNELVMNAFWHGNLGDPRLPIRISTQIVGHRHLHNDRVIMHVSDCGKGQRMKEAATDEGGLGTVMIRRSMNLVEDAYLDPEQAPFTYMIIASRSMFRELFPPFRNTRKKKGR